MGYLFYEERSLGEVPVGGGGAHEGEEVFGVDVGVGGAQETVGVGAVGADQTLFFVGEGVILLLDGAEVRGDVGGLVDAGVEGVAEESEFEYESFGVGLESVRRGEVVGEYVVEVVVGDGVVGAKHEGFDGTGEDAGAAGLEPVVGFCGLDDGEETDGAELRNGLSVERSGGHTGFEEDQLVERQRFVEGDFHIKSGYALKERNHFIISVARMVMVCSPPSTNARRSCIFSTLPVLPSISTILYPVPPSQSLR